MNSKVRNDHKEENDFVDFLVATSVVGGIFFLIFVGVTVVQLWS